MDYTTLRKGNEQSESLSIILETFQKKSLRAGFSPATANSREKESK